MSPPPCWTPQEVRNASSAVLLDVRDLSEYDAYHVPGAVWMPLVSMQSGAWTPVHGLTYVCACGKGGGRSDAAAAWIRSQGFDAVSLCGGTAAWKTPDSQ